jgi:hypothetical protein
VAHTLTFPMAVFAADLDGDGDPDVLSGEWLGSTVTWHENRGGQFAVSTVATAPATVVEGAPVQLARFDVTHAGRAGDEDLELASVALAFEQTAGDPLSGPEANALLERVSIHLDDGDGLYEPGIDLPVTASESLEPAPHLVVFEAGDPRTRIAPGASRRYLVVADLAGDASSATPASFRLRLATGSGFEARERDSGALLDPAFAADVATGTITAVADATPPFVVSIYPPDGTTDAGLATDVVLILSERIDPATMTPGLSVSAAGVKVPGVVTVSSDGTVLAFDPGAPLAVDTDYLVQVTAELTDRSGNPALPFSAAFDTTGDVGSGQIEADEIGDTTSGATIASANADDNSGFATAALGDVNGDGIADLLIGAPNADAGGIDAGRATLVFGSPALQSASGAPTLLSYATGTASEFVAETVARAGDLDNDGIQDLLIGAPRSDAGGTDGGGLWVVFGDPGLDEAAPGPLDLDDLAACGVPTLCGVKIVGDLAGDLAASAISYAGDIDADGVDDLVIGAPGASPGGRVGAGRAYVLYGPLVAGTIDLATVGSTTPGLVLNGESAGDHVGASVSHWEDAGGDGVDDLLIGAPGATTLDEFGVPIADAGYVYAIQGGTEPGKLDDTMTPGVVELGRVASGAPDEVAGMVFLGAMADGNIGRSLTGAVDTDGNGVKDVLFAGDGVIFAIAGDGPKTVNGGTRAGGEGQTFGQGLERVLGELDALADLGGVRYESGDDDTLTVGPAGDIDNDGFDDFIVGAPLADVPAGVDAGRAYVVLGGPNPGGGERSLEDVGDTIAGFAVDGAAPGDHLGASVGGGFDLNADGVDDGLVGAPFADTAAATPQDAGETYVISPIQPDEVVLLWLEELPAGTRLEWTVSDLAASYNVYRGLLATARAEGQVRTSDMTQLACGIDTDSDLDQLPDTDDPAVPAAGSCFFYLVSAENAQGEGPLGPANADPAPVNDAQCP